jgi:predicted Fe-Mo cluster-binding NifX family protein
LQYNRVSGLSIQSSKEFGTGYFMRIAFSTWKKRISPVFDVSGEVCLVDIEAGKKIREACISLPKGQDRCLWLTRQGVDVLVCGAISNHLQTRLEWMKIHVYPFVTGDTSNIVKAWVENSFKVETFAMPGCCCRFGGSFKEDKEVTDMKGRNQGQACPRGRGQGQGMGQGRTPGAGAGAQGAGVSGTVNVCKCPKCGHEAPHERGVPCLNMKCPECGEVMRGRV